MSLVVQWWIQKGGAVGAAAPLLAQFVFQKAAVFRVKGL